MLTANNLAFTHHLDQVMLESISIHLKRGEVKLIQGDNGSGKTTLLKCFAGLLELDTGTVIKEDCLYISHKPNLKNILTVFENLLFSVSLSQVPPVDTRTFEIRVLRALAQFGMAEKCHSQVATLSAGQQKKVALSNLFLQHKPVWLLDEPTTCLDKQSGQVLKERIQLHVKWGGVAVIATHQNAFFEGFTDVNASTLYL